MTEPGSQEQEAGDQSTNLQAGRDINVHLNQPSPENEGPIQKATFDEVKTFDPKVRRLMEMQRRREYRTFWHCETRRMHSVLTVVSAFLSLGLIVYWIIRLILWIVGLF
jgi:hypothetical protein